MSIFRWITRILVFFPWDLCWSISVELHCVPLRIINELTHLQSVCTLLIYYVFTSEVLNRFCFKWESAQVSFLSGLLTSMTWYKKISVQLYKNALFSVCHVDGSKMRLYYVDVNLYIFVCRTENLWETWLSRSFANRQSKRYDLRIIEHDPFCGNLPWLTIEF